MKFFLDTANLDEIKKGASWGIVDGVTTNPTLIAKEGRPDGRAGAHDLRHRGWRYQRGSGLDRIRADDQAKAANSRKIHKNIVVKCPLTRDGIKATKALSKEGIRVNVTLCFSAAQALLAAKAGAYIISPFVGRLDDIGWNGMDLIRSIVQIYKNYGYQDADSGGIAAVARPTSSIRALAGAHIGTMPFKVLDMLFNHPLTDKGLEQFLKD